MSKEHKYRAFALGILFKVRRPDLGRTETCLFQVWSYCSKHEKDEEEEGAKEDKEGGEEDHVVNYKWLHKLSAQ